MTDLFEADDVDTTFKTQLGIGEFYNNNRKDLCIPSWSFFF